LYKAKQGGRNRIEVDAAPKPARRPARRNKSTSV
jgi:hypothetical protein